MINAIIVDDKYANVVTLQKMVELYCPSVSIKGSATRVPEALDIIRETVPDLVFLDIEMPGHNGFSLLEQSEPDSFETIFTTAYDQYAIRAFKTQALDYLLKPIDIIELQQAVQKAGRQIELKRTGELVENMGMQPAGSLNKACLPTLEGYVFVDYEDIIRCEASGSYSYIHLADKRKLLVSMRLKECGEMLSQFSFMRVHHSHIVNLHYVERYVRGRGGSLWLKDGTMIDVSNNRKEAFLAAMRRQLH